MENYRALIAKYFPASQVDNALRVMQGESSGDPRAHATQGEDSRGLFQLNVGKGANPQLAQYNLYDPETNIRLAAQMYNERGWQPWTAARNLGLVEDTKAEVKTMDPDEIDAIIAGVTGGPGTTATSAESAPLFDPNELLQQGVPPVLVSTYRAAINEWNRIATGNPSALDTTASARLSQAGMRLRQIESSVLDYMEPSKAARAGGMSPVYDPRTAQEPYMTPWGEPTGGNKGDVIALQNPNTGGFYTLPDNAKPKMDPWQNPNTGQVIDRTTGAVISDAPPGYVPGRGVPAAPADNSLGWANYNLAAQKANQPNISNSGRYVLKTDPWTGETTQVYEAPQNPISPYEQANLAQSKTMADADRDAANMRQRLSTTGSVYGDMTRASQAARQWAMDPSWGGVPPGFEENGAYGQLLRMGGAQPRGVQLPQMTFDPLEAWRLAQRAAAEAR